MTPLAVFLLGCVAVYLGTIETAFTAVLRLWLRVLADRNGRTHGLGAYLDEPIRLFVPLRLLIGLVIVLAAALLAHHIGLGGLRAFGLLTIAMVTFVFVCEHLVPALIVRRNPDRVLDVLLPSFNAIARPLAPVTAALIGLAGEAGAERPPAGGAAEPAETEGAAGGAAAEIPEDRRQAGEERRLLQSIVEFGGALVREVMTPRPDIVAIRAGATLDDLRALFREQEYSRFPVFRDNLDNIAGIVFVKDLIQLVPGHEPKTVGELMRPAYFVPESKRVPELLREFQRKQVQCAIVVDEYGGTAGLVSLEDLLEEIVGEIRDEYDEESEPVVDEGNGVYLFSGKVNIGEVSERLHVPIEPEGFETVGGYVMSHLGRVPAVGEVIEIDGLVIEVLEAERRRVHKLRVRRQPETQVAESGGGE
ncbi:MAG TPA: hemolysin family protein [Vicinamibacterales bacterium]|nr:hemolysin family protein [Vicinamibacterales bacterium]